MDDTNDTNDIIDDSEAVAPEVVEKLPRDTTPKLERIKMPLRKIKEQVIINLLFKFYGNLTSVARALGIKSRQALANRIIRSRRLSLAQYEARAMLVDLAEAQNLILLLKGDAKAIDRVLRSFGKDRGWAYPETKVQIENNAQIDNRKQEAVVTVAEILRIQEERRVEYIKKYGVEPPESLRIHEGMIHDIIEGKKIKEEVKDDKPKES